MHTEPAPGWHIRTARIDDAGAIARVQIDTWHTTYRGIVPDAFLRSMSYRENTERWSRGMRMAAERNLPRVTLVAESGDAGVVGFASGGPEREKIDGYDGELYALYLLKECHGRGIGADLMKEFMRKMSALGFESMLIWVLSANPTRRFYERMGGIEVRRKTIEIGGEELEETGYGWRELRIMNYE